MGIFDGFRNALRARNSFAAATNMGYDHAGRKQYGGGSYMSPSEAATLNNESARLEGDLANSAGDLQRINAVYEQQQDANQQAHERNLQMAEQNRRMYDSQTQRQKYGVLGGLVSGMNTTIRR